MAVGIIELRSRRPPPLTNRTVKSAVSGTGKRLLAWQALSDMKATLKAHFDSVDVNNNGRLDIYEFFKLLETPEVVTTLQDMQIDVSQSAFFKKRITDSV